uniref:Uncharacterized protein n=1 Tax=Gopherus agassizii TaxID=38772 RepID=A0A452HZT9_9SAUR
MTTLWSYFLLSYIMAGWVWWRMPVIPATWEAESGRSLRGFWARVCYAIWVSGATDSLARGWLKD